MRPTSAPAPHDPGSRRRFAARSPSAATTPSVATTPTGGRRRSGWSGSSPTGTKSFATTRAAIEANAGIAHARARRAASPVARPTPRRITRYAAESASSAAQSLQRSRQSRPSSTMSSATSTRTQPIATSFVRSAHANASGASHRRRPAFAANARRRNVVTSTSKRPEIQSTASALAVATAQKDASSAAAVPDAGNLLRRTSASSAALPACKSTFVRWCAAGDVDTRATSQNDVIATGR